VTTQITIKDIDCYGNLSNSDTIIVCDELDAHIRAPKKVRDYFRR